MFGLEPHSIMATNMNFPVLISRENGEGVDHPTMGRGGGWWGGVCSDIGLGLTLESPASAELPKIASCATLCK